MNRIAIVAVLGLLVAGRAEADFITITETVTGSGSLGGTAFTNASITVIATGDTNNVTNPFTGEFEFNNASTTVLVTGFATATFTGSTLSYVNQAGSNSIAGIELGSVTSPGADILDVRAPAFASYNLTSSIGPLSGSPVFNKGFSFATTQGSFIINSTSSNATYQAVVAAASVPEPSSLVLMGIAAMTGLGYARARRRRVA